VFDGDFFYKYCPILSISPSEMKALKELPEKDKDLILPVFPLKSWVGSKELKNSIDRVELSIGKDRKWIADIDYDSLSKQPREKYRDVHYQIERLTKSQNGYRNWCDFIRSQENIVPCLQTGDLNEFDVQLHVLRSLNRGVVVIFKVPDLEMRVYEEVLTKLVGVEDLLVMIDLGQISREHVELKDSILGYLIAVRAILPNAILSLSSTSFPTSFGGYYKGVNTIYERALYDKLRIDIEDLIYSDRGSARLSDNSGGGGTPPPRIDYPCRNEWKFVRLEFSEENSFLEKNDKSVALKEEKKELYTVIAKTIMAEPYWESDLKLWANYIIELTAKGDDYGIYSAQTATAARINKHLHTQLYYDSLDEMGNTDEDWED